MMSASVFSGGIDGVGGAFAVLLHAHVERPVLAERETAPGIVDLLGRDAKVQRHTVNLGKAGRRQDAGHVAVPAADDSQAARKTLGKLGAARHGVGIAVDPPHRTVGRFQHGAGIAAATEGAVDVDAAIPRRQDGKHFLQHDRNMGGRARHHPSPSAGPDGRSLRVAPRLRAFSKVCRACLA